MKNWNEIGEKIRTISILETFKKHLTLEKQKVISDKELQVRQVHSVYSELLRKTPWSKISADEESLLIVTYILFATEGILGFRMNIIIYSLMLKGHHDVWFEQKQKFVSSFDELFEVHLSTRLKFLKRHGFQFFSEICPRDIRNAIAHMSFNIESNGTFHMKKGKKYTKKELAIKMTDIVKIVNMIDEALEQGA